jgi:hypothetical protein
LKRPSVEVQAIRTTQPRKKNGGIWKAHVTFYQYWSKEDEKQLRAYWTRERQVVLDATEGSEIALWKKTLQIFGVPPPEILPKGVAVDLTKNEAIKDPGNTSLGANEGLKNPNWPKNFCDLFGSIVCCEAFKDRLYFLQYTLEYALSLRLARHCPR